jgi:SAM-dependent methyltransferase
LSYDHLSGNVERFMGFADVYDAYRPQPPPVLVEILTQLAQVERPRLVVDLGSGTGKSTRLWVERADAVVGIEPSEDMRRQAEAATEPRAGNVRYQAGFSSDTHLPNSCADIVTCSQSLHWMEPEPTFAEAARILRPGGVFAAYDCDWPPTLHPDAEAAYDALMDQVHAIEAEQGILSEVKRWAKHEHLGRIQASGHFRYVKELLLHNREMGDARRLVGLASSQGSVAGLLKRGFSEAEIGLEALRAAAGRALGDRTIPWYFSYRVRVGVK